ncbi:MAG: hypothetical protein KDC92_00800 [Bacteroidetes bacterium]|nr:hypothetical protein [Bacteroidota bacterium]
MKSIAPKIFLILPVIFGVTWLFIFPNEFSHFNPRIIDHSKAIPVLIALPFIGYLYLLFLKFKPEVKQFTWLIWVQLAASIYGLFMLTFLDVFFIGMDDHLQTGALWEQFSAEDDFIPATFKVQSIEGDSVSLDTTKSQQELIEENLKSNESYSMRINLPFNLDIKIEVENEGRMIRNHWIFLGIVTLLPMLFFVLQFIRRKQDASL